MKSFPFEGGSIPITINNISHLSEGSRASRIHDLQLLILRYIEFGGESLGHIAKFFFAKSAVVWLRNDGTTDDFDVYSHYNRPDLETNNGKDVFNATFSLSDNSIVASRAFADRVIVYGEIGKGEFGGNWQEKFYTKNLAKQNIRYVVICPIFSDPHDNAGVMSLYFEKRPDIGLFSKYLPVAATFFHSCIEHVVRRLADANVEHRKMGHEISHEVTSGLATLDKIEKFRNLFEKLQLESSSTYTTYCSDIRSSFSNIDQSARQWRMSLSIDRSKQKATYLNIRDEYNSAVQPLLRDAGRSRVEHGSIFFEGRHCFMLIAPSHLRQIFNNLMSNAIKYSVTGGLVRLNVGRTRSGGATIKMSNLSAGMPRDEWHRVWKAGYRGKAASKLGIDGEGLGLAIVRDICEAYGIEYEYNETKADSGQGVWSNVILNAPAKLVKWG